MKESKQHKIKSLTKSLWENEKKKIQKELARQRYISHCGLGEVAIWELASDAVLCCYLFCCLIK
jgi:hypothetical protein